MFSRTIGANTWVVRDSQTHLTQRKAYSSVASPGTLCGYYQLLPHGMWCDLNLTSVVLFHHLVSAESWGENKVEQTLAGKTVKTPRCEPFLQTVKTEKQNWKIPPRGV